MKQPVALTIVNGTLVTPEGLRPGGLRCEGARIVSLGEVAPQSGDDVIDAAGRLVAPGLVDLGVFAVDKPACHFGGITRAGLMPDQSPPICGFTRWQRPRWDWKGIIWRNSP